MSCRVEGIVPPSKVTKELHCMGGCEILLGNSIGIGRPGWNILIYTALILLIATLTYEALGFAKLALQCAELRRKDRPDLGNVILPELARLRDLGQGSMRPFTQVPIFNFLYLHDYFFSQYLTTTQHKSAGHYYDLNFLAIHHRNVLPGLYTGIRNEKKVEVMVPEWYLLIRHGKQVAIVVAMEMTTMVVCCGDDGDEGSDEVVMWWRPGGWCGWRWCGSSGDDDDDDNDVPAGGEWQWWCAGCGWRPTVGIAGDGGGNDDEVEMM
nr:U-box domain-containing protein 35-like [Tanacetum cinerariifolium]